VDRVHVGGADTWRSDDGGKTWTLTSRWTLPQDDPKYTHSDIHVLAYRYPRVVPSSGDVLYSGNDGGLYRSEDGGDSWINIANMKSGISSFQVYSVCGTPQDSNLLYFGAQDNGTWRLTLDAEGKEAGAKQVFGGDGMVCQINPKNSNIVFGSYIQGQLYRSDDGGKTFPWWPPRPLPLRRGEAQWLVPYILAPDDPRTIYLCSTDLWRGNERSYFRWENLTNGATGSSVNCNQVAVSPADPKTIYIAKAAARKVRQGQNPRAAPPFLGGGGVFRSTDGGMTWQSITGNLPVTEADISDLAVSLTDPRHVWVTFADRFGGVLPKAKVFGSVDGGATWTDLSAGLPEISVDTVTAENSPLNGIYVGTDDGVYYRDDKLGKFVPFKRGLPSGIVKSLLIDQNKHRLFAGTFVRGIWLTAIPCHENCSTGPANSPQ
jgi:hypothetical protein